MKESDFINQNQEKWQDFERLLQRPHENPDKLSDLFIQITDDLSYAKTYYPTRSVRHYLNNLAQRVFYILYKNRTIEWKRLLRFWTDSMPSIIYHSRKYLLISTLFFILAVAIGALSAYQDPDFPEVILGAQYMEMTKENMASGDPMAVYKQSQEFDMFLGITLNNIWVAIRCFLFGLLAGIGTLGFLLYNGIMVGAFQTFFIQEGFGLISISTIWLHGTLEISAIIIAGAAGLLLGRGLLLPGNYSRLTSFQRYAKLGIKLLMGTLPIFVIAGFIEGYFTRYADAPYVIKFLTIGLSLVFVVGYYFWYPRYLKRRGLIRDVLLEEENPRRKLQLRSDRIKSTSAIIQDGLQSLIHHIEKVFQATIMPIMLAIFLIGIYLYFFVNNLELLVDRVIPYFEYQGSEDILFYAINSLLLGYIIWVNIRQLEKNNSSVEGRQPLLLYCLIVSFISQASIFLSFGVFLLMLLAGTSYLIFGLVTLQESATIRAVGSVRDKMSALLNTNHGVLWSISLFLCLLICCVVILYQSGFASFLFFIVDWNIFPDAQLTLVGKLSMAAFTYYPLFIIMLSWMIHAYYLAFQSFREKNEAYHLSKRIDELF